MKQAANKSLDFKEAQRLSGSCPLIFVWDGKQFQYITDVLGVAPLGAMSGDGRLLSNRSHRVHLFARCVTSAEDDANGKPEYEIHLTEELSEVSYFDQVQLMAVDHPADTEIYSNEKWKSPPFPDFRLYELRNACVPRVGEIRARRCP